MNQAPEGDVQAGVRDGDHGNDRSAAGPAGPTGSREGQPPVRNPDMSQMGEAAAGPKTI